MSMAWRRHWLRRASLTLLWVLLLLVATITANVVGIHLAGGIEGWQQWLDDHSGHFLAWRLLLYAGTTWGWCWMRRRVLAREAETGTHRRLRTAEIAAVIAIAALEISQFVQGG